jgi:hypothetical protein
MSTLHAKLDALRPQLLCSTAENAKGVTYIYQPTKENAELRSVLTERSEISFILRIGEIVLPAACAISYRNVVA